MKICAFSSADLTPGKYSIKDPRLDQVDKITKSKKKTYCTVELVAEDAMPEADAILVLEENRTDLILKDLDFVETRLGRSPQDAELALLNKLKAALEKEEFVANIGLSEEEKKLLSGGMVTERPVVVAKKEELQDRDELLGRALREGGCLSFFTTGEKETRAWLVKKGTTAWEASGTIHSDIQKGFIRAEIISFNDFIQAGGENAAKQAGKMRLEPKEYIMQDADLTNFRFNK